MYQLDAHHPFVDGELILAREVVQVLDQAVRELPHAGVGTGACGCLDLGCEVGVEGVGFAV